MNKECNNNRKYRNINDFIQCTNPIEVLPFTFEAKNVDQDIVCEIKIGSWSFQFDVEDYGTDFEVIRHSLEQYCYQGQCKLEFFFECDPTVLCLTRKRVLAEVYNDSHERKFHYEDYAKVEITPNQPGSKTFSFYCEQKACIKEIYEALLSADLYWNVFKFELTPDELRNGLIYYNKLKSPIVEEYLREKRANNDDVALRQVHIKHLIIIQPDYDYIYKDETGNCDCIFDDIVSVYDGEEELDIEVPGIYNWWSRYIDATDFTETTTDPSFDYAAWHEEGLKLVQLLREKLPDCYDLWYGYPYEDPAKRNVRPMLIRKDYEPFIKA